MNQSSRLPVLAITGTIFIVLTQLAIFASQGGAFVHMLDEGGTFMLAMLATYVMVGVALAWLGARRLRGRSVPVPMLLALSTLPLLLGLVGARLAMSRMSSVVDNVEPSMRAVILAVGMAETLNLGLLGVVVTCSLLACVAFVLSLSGPAARLSQRRIHGAIVLPVVWVVVACGALTLGIVLHPLGYGIWAVLSIAFVVSAGASGIAGMGVGSPDVGSPDVGSPDQEAKRATSAIVLVPVIGVVIAYISATGLYFTQAVRVFAALAGATGSEKLRMLDFGWMEASESFAASLFLMAGPLAALLIALLFVRKNLTNVLSAHRLFAALSALLLLCMMGLSGIARAGLNDSALLLADRFMPELPELDLDLPVVDDVFAEVGHGAIVVLDTELHVDGETLGAIASVDPGRLRTLLAGRDIVLFADRRVSTGQLLVVLGAASSEEYPISVDVVVHSEQAPREYEGILRGRRAPPPAFAFQFLAGQSFREHHHLSVDGEEHRDRAQSDDAMAELMFDEVITADDDVPIERLLRALHDRRVPFAATPPAIPEP